MYWNDIFKKPSIHFLLMQHRTLQTADAVGGSDTDLGCGVVKIKADSVALNRNVYVCFDLQRKRVFESVMSLARSYCLGHRHLIGIYYKPAVTSAPRPRSSVVLWCLVSRVSLREWAKQEMNSVK